MSYGVHSPPRGCRSELSVRVVSKDTKAAEYERLRKIVLSKRDPTPTGFMAAYKPAWIRYRAEVYGVV